MKRLSNIAVSLCFLFLVAPCWAGCEEPVIPDFPNPDLAGQDEMLRAEKEVKQYLALQEDFLNCVQHNTRKHNRAVDLMYQVAEKYNSIARRYNTRLQALDMFTDLAYVDVSRF